MTIDNVLKQLNQEYNIVGQLDLNHWYTLPLFQRELWL